MANTNYQSGSLIGAKFGDTHTDAKFALGTRAQGNNGTVWMYCQASTTLTQYDCSVIDSSFKANPITTALTTEGASIGFPQVAVPITEYFWAALEGRTVNIRVASSCAANVPLYTTATAGVLDDAVANNLMNGIKIVTTQGSTTGLAGTPAYVVYPSAGASV
jgi:hypothetical protein